jgi:N-methylhydantoinase B
MTEATIQNIPNGVYIFEDVMESDGQSEQEIPIVATITVEDSHMTVDFSESAPQVSGNINAVESIARSATWYAVRLLAEDDIPVNHGCFDPVTIITRPGSVLNPHFPAATAAGNVETSQRIVDVVLGALAQALPDKIPAASQGTMNNVTIGGITHSQDNTAQSFVYYETIGGGHGAGPLSNGIAGLHSHMTNTLNTPVEAIEYTFPLRVLEYGLRDKSGGKGKYQGGDGVRRTYQFLSPATVTVNSERRINTPYGLRGGKPGKSGVNYIEQNGKTRKLGGKHSIQVKEGDKLIIETPGGGGWG